MSLLFNEQIAVLAIHESTLQQMNYTFLQFMSLLSIFPSTNFLSFHKLFFFYVTFNNPHAYYDISFNMKILQNVLVRIRRYHYANT